MGYTLGWKSLGLSWIAFDSYLCHGVCSRWIYGYNSANTLFREVATGWDSYESGAQKVSISLIASCPTRTHSPPTGTRFSHRSHCPLRWPLILQSWYRLHTYCIRAGASFKGKIADPRLYACWQNCILSERTKSLIRLSSIQYKLAHSLCKSYSCYFWLSDCLTTPPVSQRSRYCRHRFGSGFAFFLGMNFWLVRRI